MKSVPMPIAVANRSSSKPLRRSCLCLQRFDITISRRRIRYQRFEQMMRGVRNFVDGAIKRFFVCV